MLQIRSLKEKSYESPDCYFQDFVDTVTSGGAWSESNGTIQNSLYNYIYIFYDQTDSLLSGFSKVLETNFTHCTKLSYEQAKCYLVVLDKLEQWALRIQQTNPIRERLLELIKAHGNLSLEIYNPISELAIQQTQSVKEAFVHLSDLGPKVASLKVIQALCRGHLARRPFLSKKLRNQARHFIGDVGNDSHTLAQKSKMAKGGVTKVYLPLEISGIVIKHITKGSSDKRFRTNLFCSDVLNELNIKHLILPRAWLMDSHHVEERLSINIKKDYNLGIYYRNLSCFDEVVREFVQFYSKVYVQDIVNETTVNYSNLPFLLEKNEKTGFFEGKVGLIDVEYLVNYSFGIKGFKDLALIFPEHVKIIMEELDKLEIDCDRNMLEEFAKITRDKFETSYLVHANYLEENCIKQIKHPDFLSLKEAEKNELIDLVVKGLKEKNPSNNKDVKKIAKSFIEKVEKCISDEVTEGNKTEIPEWELVAGRTIKIESYLINDGPYYHGCKNFLKPEYVEDLLEIVLHFFLKKGYIFCYSKKYRDFTLKY